MSEVEPQFLDENLFQRIFGQGQRYCCCQEHLTELKLMSSIEKSEKKGDMENYNFAWVSKQNAAISLMNH